MITDIYQEQDGFYIGSKKKDGSFAKGARKVTADEILTMFTTFFNDYCDEQKTDRLMMQDAQSDYIITAKIKK